MISLKGNNKFRIIGIAFIFISLINATVIIEYQSRYGRTSQKKATQVKCFPVYGDCRKILNREILNKSLELGTQYMVKSQRKDGAFTYSYNWISGNASANDNQVRQGGALWSLAAIYNETGNEKLLPTLKAAFEFYKKNTREKGTTAKWIVYPGERRGRTGTMAQVSLALVELLRNGDKLGDTFKSDVELHLDGYLEFLLSLKTESGHFFDSYLTKNGRGFGRPSPYYDGQTILALIKAKRYLNKDISIEFLKTATTASFNEYVTEAMKFDPDPKSARRFFQYGIMCCHEIINAGWDTEDIYSKEAMALADWMIDIHCTLQRSSNISYALEGIIYASDIAEKTGNKTKAEKYSCAVDKGLLRVTTWQVGSPVPNKFLRMNRVKDNRAIGGAMNKRKGEELRIDIVQHQMYAVLLARKYLYRN